jgi:sporulation protein YlmC with PRC-barrel domain
MGAVLAQEQRSMPEPPQDAQKPIEQEKGPHVIEVPTAERTAAEAEAEKIAQQERAEQDLQESQAGQERSETGERLAQDSMPSQHALPARYLASQPANAFRMDQLIGSDLRSKVDDETIGSIGDVVIDEDGQILAVIVEVGGFLGLGKKEVAISWDSVEHSMKEKGDGYDFSVVETKEALRDAPEYRREAGKY